MKKKTTILENLATEILAKNRELAVAWAAGCEIQVSSKKDADGNTVLSFKTKYPVAIEDLGDNNIKVVELKN